MAAIGGALFFAIGVDSGVVLFLAAHIIVMVGIPFISAVGAVRCAQIVAGPHGC